MSAEPSHSVQPASETSIRKSLTDVIQRNVAVAIAEDVRSGDLTAALIAENESASARVITREPGVLAGQLWFDEVFRQLNSGIQIDWRLQDGDAMVADQVLCTLQGSKRALLTGERTALNFLQTLSATATVTAQYVEQIRGTGAAILDTRKTIPGLRDAQKYAVTCGGGRNHRMGLYDGILIKENHIMAAGSISAAVAKAKRSIADSDIQIEVEVENLEQLQEALNAGADIVLLDNFSVDVLRQAVSITQRRAKLEASGGVALDSIRFIAETGVDFISVGALTKHVRAVDLSMRFVE